MGSYVDYSSFFIEGRALFGSYPSQKQVNDLIGMDVKYFIDLTVPGEVFPPYSTGDVLYANFPILDRKTPSDITQFTVFTLAVYNAIVSLKGNEKMYLHCKGGHGRAGILVAILLYLHLGNISTQKALELTTKYHGQRRVMRQKWRDIGSPQTRSQKAYVHRFFGELVFYRAYRRGPSHGFSSYSFHTINVPSEQDMIPTGLFPSSEAAYQASKNAEDPEYVQKHVHAKNPRVSRKIGERVRVNTKWLEKRYDIMRYLVRLKLDQHEDVLRNLMKTGLRQIIFNSKVDAFFGTGGSDGRNLLGKILMDVRNERYQQLLPEFAKRAELEVSVTS